MFRLAFTLALMSLAFAACTSSDSEGPAGTPTGADGSPEPLIVQGTITLLGRDPDDAAAGMAAGDFNGDGAADIVLGAAFGDGPDNAREDAGEVLVFMGPFQADETRDGGAGDNDAVIYGADPGDQAGRAVGAADVNGDGIDDVIIGVPFADGPAEDREDVGEAVVVLGSTVLGAEDGEVDLRDGADLTVVGPAPGALTGFSLASGAIDGDAYADLVIGSFQANGFSGLAKAGVAHVVLGAADLPTLIDTAQGESDMDVSGPTEGAWLGETVNAGDFNGDGLDDLLLTAAFAPTAAGEDAGGQVSVILSPPATTIDLSSESADHTIYGEGEGDQIGHSSATGDIDGDGLADALLGAVSSDGPGDSVKLAGEAIVIRGASLQERIDVAAGDADSLAYGTAAADRLGRSAAIGDVDGDGLADLVFGLPGADSPDPPIVDSGGIYVVYGGTSLPALIDLRRDGQAHFGDTGGGQLSNGVEGRPALSTADIDGDGRDEILVSASDGGDVAGAGSAYVLFLAARVDD
jgi:hypothetical protein